MGTVVKFHYSIALLAALFAVPAYAGTTTINFDNLPDGTDLTTQYASLGVTFSGAQVQASSSASFFPPNSTPNVAFSSGGIMTITFDSSILGTVSAVSAYLDDFSGPAGIYAYDANNQLLGQAILPSSGALNMLLSVSSSGASIAYVQIHDGGGQFSVDDFTFTYSGVATTCLQKADQLAQDFAALHDSDFKSKKPGHQQNDLERDAQEAAALISGGARAEHILREVRDLRSDAFSWLALGNTRNTILSATDQLIAATLAGQCGTPEKHHHRHHR